MKGETMTDQPVALTEATNEPPVDVLATDVPAVDIILKEWSSKVEGMARQESYRSQINGMRDALKLVVAPKFGHETHVGKISVNSDGGPFLVFFHYHVPLVSSSDRRPKQNAPVKLAGIVKDPRMTTSVPAGTMLGVHKFVAGKATNRSVQLQADYRKLIAYYQTFGYSVDAGQESADKPNMTATLDAMTVSEAAGN
ncbi:hypothetical protein [Amycolatopsis nigrescens]|uniref:hypothetical protein n=1 Tax=Amycolatopsis nigrescens TaxID=381445 RepID=UPI0012F70C5A|nr:hypothetical protein [Amycolatopsis nigrescens]